MKFNLKAASQLNLKYIYSVTKEKKNEMKFNLKEASQLKSK